MHGMIRSGVKHVCSQCLLHVRQQNAVGLTVAASHRIPVSHPTLSRAPAFQNVASYSKQRRPKYKQKPLVRARFSIRKPSGVRHQHATSLDISNASDGFHPFELDEDQQKRIRAIHNMRKRMAGGMNSLTSQHGESSENPPLTFSTALDSMPGLAKIGDKELVRALKAKFGNDPIADVNDVLARIAIHRNTSQRKVSDRETVEIMAALGLIRIDDIDRTNMISSHAFSAESSQTTLAQKPGSLSNAAPPVNRYRGGLMKTLNAVQEARKAQISRRGADHVPSKLSGGSYTTAEAKKKSQQGTLNPREITLQPLEVAGHKPHIPDLSFDLSRVLFNPGIYHLQDPRSRVFNFDPYLALPMPMSEFNFGALNEYITSSKDETLIAHALAHRKRYIGSSSSMSGALCQFHFLLSQFREINTANLSRGFDEDKTDFTMISKAPAAIFLRWRSGVYAVDADKEYDTPNVLLSLGKSLEKLLTLDKSEFEKWRKTGTAEDEKFSDSNPEAYYYSTQGNFLLRSQLDAKDARLPGTGVFDLKTRAVAAIRMNVQEHEMGMGYEIRHRFGTWESYEREYYDMMRAAFLKYSMQVRMGNMDGIFVAYHNIQRLFGFQYIPITELDLALHGQSDPSIGDQEFRMSIDLMNQIFDIVTAKFPKQSIRFHFDTRDVSAREPRAYMNVYAEPMTDKEINEIQAKQDSEFAAYEKKIGGTSTLEAQADADQGIANPSSEPVAPPADELSESRPEINAKSQSSDSSDANPEMLARVFQQVPADTELPEHRPVLGLRINITNKVNEIAMTRPIQITAAARWTVDFAIEELEDEAARKLYIQCKNRRMAALRYTAKERHTFLAGIHEMSRSGAVWRQEQDEVDAEREQVVLYPHQAT